MQDISPSLDAFNEVSTITTSPEYVSRIHLQFSSLSKSQKRIYYKPSQRDRTLFHHTACTKDQYHPFYCHPFLPSNVI